MRGRIIAPRCSVTPTPGRGPEDDGNGEDDVDITVDMDLLRRRIREVETSDTDELTDDDIASVEVNMDFSGSDKGFEVGGVASNEDSMRVIDAFENVRELYVIVFKSRDRQEGVYSLEIGHENVVLAFQERAEAQQYATLLELKKFPTAKVCRLETSELREFCKREGYRLGFVMRGAVGVKPPDESAIDDPERWGISDNEKDEEKEHYDGSSGLSKDELDLMKRRLDSLFGNGSGSSNE